MTTKLATNLNVSVKRIALALALALAAGVSSAVPRTLTWAAAAGGDIDQGGSVWGSPDIAAPDEESTLQFHKTVSSPFTLGDSLTVAKLGFGQWNYRTTNTLALGVGKTLLATNKFEVAGGSRIRLASGTVGSTPSASQAEIGDDYNNGNTFIIDGPDAKYVTPLAKDTGLRFARSKSRARLEIINGGQFEGYVHSMGLYRSSVSNTVLVSGAGSRFTIPPEANLYVDGYCEYSRMAVGGSGCYNDFIVADGAEMVVDNTGAMISVGARHGEASGGDGNRFIVRNGGKVRTKSAVWAGRHGSSNSVEIVDGGSLVIHGANLGVSFFRTWWDKPLLGQPLVGNRVLVSGEGSTLDITNGVLMVGAGTWEKEADRGPALGARVDIEDGARMYVTNGLLRVGGWGYTNSVLSIRSGATLELCRTGYNPSDIGFGGAGACVEVDGGTFDSYRQPLRSGRYGFGTNASWRVDVRNGGLFRALSFAVGCANGGVVAVSNATIEVSPNGAFNIGPDGGTGNVVSLAGTNSLIRPYGDFAVQGDGTEIQFHIGREPTERLQINAYRFNFNKPTRIKVTDDPRRMDGGRITILKANHPDHTIDLSNVTFDLPDDVSVEIPGPKEVVLHMHNRHRLILLVR